MAATPKAKTQSIEKPMTKSEIVSSLAEHAEINKKQAAAVLDHISTLIEWHLGKKGPGQFTLPNLAKITVVKKPAVKAKKGKNPFTGEEMTFKAKPARNVVKVRPLKKMKDMV